MIGTSTFEPALPKEYPQPEETQPEAPYICEIVDVMLGDSDGFVKHIGMRMSFPSEIEGHPEDLYMFHTVDLERPPENEFISFDDATMSMLKQWARVGGDLDNVVIEHRNRVRQMIESTNPSSDSDS
jgi:hypothetical protein